MKSSIDAAALTWRGPPAIASPWGRRPATLWAFAAANWRESMAIHARAHAYRLPLWGPFL
jgi:hypothetical protein